MSLPIRISQSGLLPDSRLQGSCLVVVNSSRCHGANVTMGNVNKTNLAKTGGSAIGGLRVPTTTLGGGRRNKLQDSGKGDCSGCGCGFRLRTNAENSVMTSPIGKGSTNVSSTVATTQNHHISDAIADNSESTGARARDKGRTLYRPGRFGSTVTGVIFSSRQTRQGVALARARPGRTLGPHPSARGGLP